MLPSTSSRRPHRKTKTGCVVCKRRKIKCDEGKPTCKNCIHYGENCEYVPARPRGSGASATKTPPTSVPSHLTDNSAAASPNLFQDDPSPRNDFTPLSISSNELNLAHLELLHHYCIATSATLHHDPVVKILWRTTVVDLGVSHDYVMHAILALAALHLGYLIPHQREYYIAQAMDHHQKGLNVATGNMLHVTEQNCSSLYIFSVMAFIFALAGPRPADNLFIEGSTGLSEWLILLRGTGHILHFSEATILAGPLGPIFKAGRRRDGIRTELSKVSCEEFDQLQDLNNAINNSVPDTCARQVYNSAVNQLRHVYTVVYTEQWNSAKLEPSDVFAWVFRVPKDYIALLKDQTPQSLAILAYFAVLIKPLEDLWWLEGLSAHLISRISFLCGDENRHWIEWPLQVMGWTNTELIPTEGPLDFDAITPFSDLSKSTY